MAGGNQSGSHTKLVNAIVKALTTRGHIAVKLLAIKGWYRGSKQGREWWVQGCPVGTPDIVVATADGRTVWLEAKTGDGRLSAVQRAWHAWAHGHKHVVRVVRSVEDAIECAEGSE